MTIQKAQFYSGISKPRPSFPGHLLAWLRRMMRFLPIGAIADDMQSMINAIEHDKERLSCQNLDTGDTRRLTHIGTDRVYASACLRKQPIINSNLSFLPATRGFRFTEA